MAGRFLSAPLFLAALLLVDLFRTKGCCLVVLLSIGALLFGPRTVFASFQIPSCRIEDAWRIADQRLRYQGWTSPRNYKDRAETAIERLFGRGVRFSQPDGRVVVSKAIGMPAFFRLAGKIIVDPYALSDPLLARLPVANPDSWRIGHFKRDIPAGYLETLETGANSIEDPALREYYDKLTILTQGDLWSWERLKTILRFNMGRYENLRFDYVERVRPAVASSGRRVVRVPERAAKGPECALW
ncbi:MAG: hypothetical protein EBZ48_11205 [Proteobacteria bacterium]|nr:hypothetical protein [Pseudomonadota bacterium]